MQRLNDRRQALHDEVIHISGEREIELGEVRLIGHAVVGRLQ